MQLGLILVYTLVSRLWQIGHIPPSASSSFLSGRIINAFVTFGIVSVLYYSIRRRKKSQKLALLSVWTFTVLPWTFAEGRIISQVNLAVFFLLLFLIFGWKGKIFQKAVSSIILGLLFYFLYPTMWIFRLETLPKLKDTLQNFFIILSPEYLFFKNIYFWWGGVRDFGILPLAFLPFLIIGISQAIKKRNRVILTVIVFIVLFTAVSPFFPETREFYLAIPFMSYLIALGLDKTMQQTNNLVRFIAVFIFLFFIYEQIQYFHFYTTHYYLEVKNNLFRLNEPF